MPAAAQAEFYSLARCYAGIYYLKFRFKISIISIKISRPINLIKFLFI